MKNYNRFGNIAPTTLTVETGYYGWANYETWCVNLWLTNDQGSYTFTCEVISDAPNMYEAAQNLKAAIDDLNPLASEASMFSDLLNAALSEVDWFEIVENFRED